MLKITQKEENDLDRCKVFNDLKLGEIFVYLHDYRSNSSSVKIYQKVAAKDTSYSNYAIDMKSGILYEISNTALVIPVEKAELVFTVK